jgi:hypothetical protein
MLRTGRGQTSQVENLKCAIRTAGQRDAGLFANPRQGERAEIFEKTGIGHGAAPSAAISSAQPAAAR